MQPCDTTHPDWQKMISGQWYLTQSKVLLNARAFAKYWCYRLNQLPLQQAQKRQEILHRLLPDARSLTPQEHFYCDYGSNIVAGGEVQIGSNVVILDGANVTLGDQVLINDNTLITTVTHAKDPSERQAGWQQTRPVHIGDNVVLGKGVSVLPGANIPNNTRVADNTVITASTFLS